MLKHGLSVVQCHESGFYYLQSRYYDPSIGRFINADGQLNLDLISSNNLFSYCKNNPINFSDTEGTDAALAATWAGSMWWLALVDGPLLIGDIVLGVGLVIAFVVVVDTLNTATPLRNTFSDENEIPPIVYTKSSNKPKAGRPELKKQGREGLEKKKGQNWEKRSGKQEREQPRPHHPSKRGHRKYNQSKY